MKRFFAAASVLMVLFVFIAGVSFAAAEKSAKLDKEMLGKVKEFLNKRGREAITVLDGESTKIENGYFLKVNGVDKSINKNYYIEIFCNDDYSIWSLLACIDKADKKPLLKSKKTK